MIQELKLKCKWLLCCGRLNLISNKTALYSTLLHRTVLYCTLLYCTILYCIVLYCTVLYCAAMWCTVHNAILYLYCNVLPLWNHVTSLTTYTTCVIIIYIIIYILYIYIHNYINYSLTWLRQSWNQLEYKVGRMTTNNLFM